MSSAPPFWIVRLSAFRYQTKPTANHQYRKRILSTGCHEAQVPAFLGHPSDWTILAACKVPSKASTCFSVCHLAFSWFAFAIFWLPKGLILWLKIGFFSRHDGNSPSGHPHWLWWWKPFLHTTVLLSISCWKPIVVCRAKCKTCCSFGLDFIST